MRAIRDGVVHVVVGAGGLVFGVLSVVALTVAAVIPPVLGLIAFVLSPIRALGEKLQGLGRG